MGAVSKLTNLGSLVHVGYILVIVIMNVKGYKINEVLWNKVK